MNSISDNEWDLGQGYSLKLMPDQKEFESICRPFHDEIFLVSKPTMKRSRVVTPEEKDSAKHLVESMSGVKVLNFGVFHDGNFVGWHYGIQRTAEIFYMTNSALLKEHRGKGIYKAMLKKVVEIVGEQGFQTITSRHIATNNSVIVPKLKAGFVITGLEVNEVFGVLVNLTYHMKQIRRDILTYRCGDSFPSAEVLAAIE